MCQALDTGEQGIRSRRPELDGLKAFCGAGPRALHEVACSPDAVVETLDSRQRPAGSSHPEPVSTSPEDSQPIEVMQRRVEIRGESEPKVVQQPPQNGGVLNYPWVALSSRVATPPRSSFLTTARARWC
jgi:hypothetical protein